MCELGMDLLVNKNYNISLRGILWETGHRMDKIHREKLSTKIQLKLENMNKQL